MTARIRDLPFNRGDFKVKGNAHEGVSRDVIGDRDSVSWIGLRLLLWLGYWPWLVGLRRGSFVEQAGDQRLGRMKPAG